VDKALQVIDQYHTNITKFEHDVLLRPDIAAVKKCKIICYTLVYSKTQPSVRFQCISCRAISFFINGPLNQLKRWSMVFDDTTSIDVQLWLTPLIRPTRMSRSLGLCLIIPKYTWYARFSQSYPLVEIFLGGCIWPYGIYLNKLRYVFWYCRKPYQLFFQCEFVDLFVFWPYFGA